MRTCVRIRYTGKLLYITYGQDRLLMIFILQTGQCSVGYPGSGAFALELLRSS